MTFAQWKEKYPLLVDPTKPNAVFTPSGGHCGLWELYHLTDYAVSSANAVYTRLIRRAVAAA